MPGFHQYDKNGAPAGYDVEYLRRVAAYTGWTFQYVRMENWDEALDALAEKRIDLLGSTQLTAARAERFDFCAYSNGTTHAAIIALGGNTDMSYEGFDAFSERRFGCVRTYVRQDEFAAYAKKKGFTPVMTWFDSTEQMRKALHAREIDAMLCSIMELDKDEKVVAEFAPAPFYYITWKGNEEVLEDLNAAISRIKIDMPTFEEALMDRSYPVFRTPSFSHREAAYVKDHPVLCVGLFVNRSPFSSLNPETEQFEGITPEIMELIGRDSGFSIKPVPIPLGTNPLALLKNGDADAVAGVVRFPAQEQDHTLRLTEPFFSTQLILLAHAGRPFIPALPLKAAIPAGFRAAAEFIKTEFPHFTIVEYPGTRRCLDAVLSGDVDVTLNTSIVLEKFLQGPRYKELSVVPTISTPEKDVIALSSSSDPLLFSILNKSIRRLPGAVIEQIVIKHTVAKPYVITLNDFLFQYRTELLGGSALLALCCALLAWALRQRRKNIELIRENEETLRNITNNINGGVITLIVDKGFTITYANNGFLELVGYTRQEYEKEQLRECITYVHSDDIQTMNDAIGAQHDGETLSLEMRILHRSGRYIPVMFRGTLARNREGLTILFCVVVDISEQRAMIENLTIEKERYEIVIEQSNDIIFEVDLQQHTLVCSPKFQQKFGWQMKSSDISGSDPYPLKVHPEDSGTLQQMLAAILHGERTVLRQLRVQKNDGDYLWCRLLVSCIRHENKLIKLIGRLEDVDDMVRERLRLEEISKTDSLCGLYNTMALRLSVERLLKQNEKTDTRGALFFIDIDNFKAVNDTLGHPIGDQALRDVAATLRVLFRADDIIGRYGGDEFCVFALHMPETLVRQKAGELNTRLRRSYRDEQGRRVDVSASVGVSCWPSDAVSYMELVEKADRAAYAAKANGKNCYVMFSHNMEHAEATCPDPGQDK